MSDKIHTEEGIRDHYQKSEIVDIYEQKRFGNIKKSLAHWLDIDAIEYFIKKYCNASGSFLDLACGTGRLTRGILARGFNVTSADYSKEMIAAAEEKCRQEHLTPNFAREDAFNLSFGDQHFDGIFTMRFIRHFELDKRKELYPQIHRVLKKDGYLIFDILNADVDVDAHKRLAHDETYTVEGITQELKENGFELVERVAGNVADVPLVTFAKKWRIMSLGRALAKGQRIKEDVMARASYWMAAARKIQ